MTTNHDTTPSTFVPAYNLTWQRFVSSLDRMAADDDLPAVIDRSYLNRMPGNVQTSYLALCRNFRLVDSADAPTALLRDLVYHPDSRSVVIERLVREHYAPILELDLNATAQQLLDLWKETFNQSGETRRKAVRFFMAAANFAGISLSRNWERDVSKISRTGSSPRRSKPRAPQIPKQTSAPESASRPTETVILDHNAGSLSITVEFDPLKATAADREFVFGFIDSIHQYRDAHDQNTPNDTTDGPDDITF